MKLDTKSKTKMQKIYYFRKCLKNIIFESKFILETIFPLQVKLLDARCCSESEVCVSCVVDYD